MKKINWFFVTLCFFVFIKDGDAGCICGKIVKVAQGNGSPSIFIERDFNCSECPTDQIPTVNPIEIVLNLNVEQSNRIIAMAMFAMSNEKNVQVWADNSAGYLIMQNSGLPVFRLLK